MPKYYDTIHLYSGLIWLLIILSIGYYRYYRNRRLPHYKFYMYNLGIKLLFGTLFGVYYTTVIDGGDTAAYWEGATTLNNLFVISPSDFITEMFHSGQSESWTGLFNNNTGYPPGWIYREPEGWFISKIASFFSLITFKSYWAATFLFGYIFAQASWRVFELALSFKLNKPVYSAIAFLFLPSVSFWCATISKDAVVLTATFYLVYHLFQILTIERRSTVTNWIVSFICLYLILQTRSVVLLAILAPVLFAITARLRKKYKNRPFISNSLALITIAIGILGMFVVMRTQSDVMQGYMTEAAVVQQDFINNATYGNNRYDLGITDYSPTGMIKAIPASILAGTLRPYPWEALSVSLILNGLESAFFMFLLVRFLFSKGLKERIKAIQQSEFLMYSFYFMLIMAFMAGFTGIIFGVLVRFKASALPFLVLVLSVELKKSKKQKDQKSNNLESARVL
jgi:hypothetical protein